MSETNKMDKLILNGQNIDLSPDYQNIRNKPKINGVTVDGNKTLDDFGVATKQEVENVSKEVAKLPYGIYYGQYDDVESLPDASQLTQKGYAYIASTDPNIFYIYTYDGKSDIWQDSGNKFDSGSLENNLSTKSQTKAPTTKAVQEGIEAIDVTLARSIEDENELTETQKFNASSNINDRGADVVQGTGEINSLGYKILNPNKSFASQVTASNTIYEIRDKFDLNNTSIELPQNCTLKFNGGMLANGSVKANGVSIDAPNTKIFENITFVSGYESLGSLNIVWLGAKIGVDSYDNSVHLQDWYDNYSRVFKTVYFPQASYYFKSTVRFSANSNKRGLCLDGGNSIFYFGDNENIDTEHAFIYLHTELFTIKDVTLKNTEDVSTTRAIGIYLDGSGSSGGCQRFALSSLTIQEFDIGVSLFACWYGSFEGRTYISNCRIGCFIREIAGNISAYVNREFEINNISFLNLVIRCTNKSYIYNSANRLSEKYTDKVVYDSLSTTTIDSTTYLVGNAITIDDSKKYLVSNAPIYLLKKNNRYEWVEISPVEDGFSELEELPDADEEYENNIVKVSDHYYQCQNLEYYEEAYEGNYRIKNVDNGIYYPAVMASQNISEFYVIYGNENFYFESSVTGIDSHCFIGNVKFHGISLEGLDYGLRFNWGVRTTNNARESSIVDVKNCYFESIREYTVFIGQGWKTSNDSYSYIYNTRGNISNCHFVGKTSAYFRFGKFTWNDNTGQHGTTPPVIILEGNDILTGYTSLSYNGTPTIETVGKRIIINRIQGTNFSYRKSISNHTEDNLYTSPKNVLFNTIDNRVTSLPLVDFSSSESTPSNLAIQQYDSNLISFSSLCGIRHIIYPYPIIDGYIYKPSGGKLIKKPVHDNYVAITQTTEGTPFDVFYKVYWEKGITFIGKIRNLFPYEVIATPSLGTVVNADSNDLVGFGIKRAIEEDNSVSIQGIGTDALQNNTSSIFIDGLIAVYRSSAFVKYYVDLAQCGMQDETIPTPGSLNASTGYYTTIARTTANLNSRIKQLNAIVFNTSTNKLLIFDGYDWVELTDPWTRYSYVDSGSSINERMARAEVDGQTFYNKATGITYTGAFSTNRIDFSWKSSIGIVDSLEHPNGYNANNNPLTYATELTAGECVICNGKLYSWNGSAWLDGNGEPAGLQVSDTSVLIGAADNSTTINVYHANALNVTALNPDNTSATWLTVPSTVAVGTNTLTITAAANTASNPRGAKVIIEDGADVVIVNVVQNYSTT